MRNRNLKGVFHATSITWLRSNHTIFFLPQPLWRLDHSSDKHPYHLHTIRRRGAERTEKTEQVDKLDGK